MLLDGAIHQAKNGGAEKLFLEVAEDNNVARALYVSRGFVAVGRRQNYYTRNDGTSAAAVTMSRYLKTETLNAGR